MSSLTELFATSKFVKTDVIQTLWSGYGEISRYSRLDKSKSMITKFIIPPSVAKHPRGWNTHLSHQRKLDSYRNERLFYQGYAQQVNRYCRVPLCFAAHAEGDNSCLIIEDLDAAGFHRRSTRAHDRLARLGIVWLAKFHALFLQTACPELWAVGTYWHLKTRPDEWHAMPDGPLKRSASVLNERLNSASYQTLLHGDAKLANFCFDDAFESLAAVDFQYVGKGVGVKDLMYFLGSCFTEDELFDCAAELVDYYFDELGRACQHHVVDIDFQALETEWRYLLPYAWADFERFLAGWAGEHHKRHGYSNEQTQIALDDIRGVS